MKKKGHPTYQEILFVDSSTGYKFICGSTLQPIETETFEGKKYPVCIVAISSASHPFFTGSKQFIDTEGRVDKFTKKYQNKKQKSIEEKKKEEEASKKVKGKTKKVVRVKKK